MIKIELFKSARCWHNFQSVQIAGRYESQIKYKQISLKINSYYIFWHKFLILNVENKRSCNKDFNSHHDILICKINFAIMSRESWSQEDCHKNQNTLLIVLKYPIENIKLLQTEVETGN